MYSISNLLASSIDVLSKFYSGNTEDNNVGDCYIKFIKKYFIPFQNLIEGREFYKDYRCSIVHSNSTKLEISVDSSIFPNVVQFIQKKHVINLIELTNLIEQVLFQYTKDLEADNELYNNFINVNKKLYK